MIPAGTKIRVTRGPHAGLDGTVTAFSHGVYTLSSWLTGEEFWALANDVVPLADAPRCAHCVEREKRVDDLRAVLSRLVDTLPKCQDYRGCTLVAARERLHGPYDLACDEHRSRDSEDEEFADVAYADALRAALAVLGRAPHG